MLPLRSRWQWFAIGLILSAGGCNTPVPPMKPPTATSSTSNTATSLGEAELGAAAPTTGSVPASPSQPDGPTAAESPTVPSPTVPSPTAPSATVPSATEASATAKAVELRELNWEQLQELVAHHKGRVVVVDLWSTSCEPCLIEFPHLVALQKRHPDDVVCISFDCDFIGAKNKPVGYYRERVLKFLTSQNSGQIINGISTLAADELFDKLDVDSIPAVYVYDQTGKLSKRFDNRTPVSATEEGISYEKQIDPLVTELLKAENN